jgi:hypothetical protein
VNAFFDRANKYYAEFTIKPCYADFTITPKCADFTMHRLRNIASIVCIVLALAAIPMFVLTLCSLIPPVGLSIVACILVSLLDYVRPTPIRQDQA